MDNINYSEVKEINFEISPPFWQRVPFILTMIIFFILLFYLIIINVIRGVNRKNEKKQQIKELQAQALRAQLNPHFIFNFLNSVQALIFKEELNSASDFLSNFADLMREYLNSFDTQTITLEKELELIESYLDLEKLRFKDQLLISLNVNGSLNGWSVIPLFSQPIIENAIIHGASPMKKGELEITLDATATILKLSIRDNGNIPFDLKKINISSSKGIELTKRRLQNWNDRNTMNFVNLPDGHEVTFTIYKK